MRLIDNIAIAIPDAVAAAASDFTVDTNVIDMSNYRRVAAVLVLTQSGAGTATVTLKQSAAADGSDEKALAFTSYLKNETGVTTSALTLIEATTLTTAGALTGTNTYVFDIKSEDLDVENSFRYVRLDVASLSNNTAAALFYVAYEPRHTAGATDIAEAIA